MSDSFADLFEQSLKQVDMTPGAIVTGTVIDIDSDWVTVHAGLKSEGVIPRNQFLDDQGNLSLEVGDEVKVALETVEDGFGETRLSREKAKRAESWMELEAAWHSTMYAAWMYDQGMSCGAQANAAKYLGGEAPDVGRRLRRGRPVQSQPRSHRGWRRCRSRWRR